MRLLVQLHRDVVKIMRVEVACPRTIVHIEDRIIQLPHLVFFHLTSGEDKVRVLIPPDLIRQLRTLPRL